MTSDPANTPPTKTPDAATIDFDLACVRCGYDLSGLNATGHCPECNQQIVCSLAGRLLRFADPQWVAAVRRGVLTRIMYFAICFLLGVVLYSRGVGGGTRPVGETALFAAMTFLNLFATVWITDMDPAGTRSGPGARAQLCARLFSCSAVAFGSVALLAGPWSSWTYPLVLGSVLLAGGSILAELVYSKILARRIPNSRFLNREPILAWTMAVCWMVTSGLLVCLAFLPALGWSPRIGRGVLDRLVEGMIALVATSSVGLAACWVCCALIYISLANELGNEIEAGKLGEVRVRTPT